jgi:hypothetical protein
VTAVTITAPSSLPRHRVAPWWRSELDRLAHPRTLAVAVTVAVAEFAVAVTYGVTR